MPEICNNRNIEFIAMVAMMMSLAALSIDAVMPALPAISESFEVFGNNTIQLVITALILGMTIGQLIYGPISDRFGRKATMNLGVGILLTGILLTLNANHYFSLMLWGRFLQGFGIAAMRIVPLAIIRDRFKGVEMARILSLAMAAFILVPCVAPLFGQWILSFANWKSIFWIQLFLTISVTVWFSIRQPETLLPKNRCPLNLRSLTGGLIEVFSNRIALGYTIAMGFIQGTHIGFLLSAEPIFHQCYHSGDMFALYFAISAVSIGFASIVNAQVVEKLGMTTVVNFSCTGSMLVSLLSIGLSLTHDLSLPVFLILLSILFFFVGLMLGNMNAIAMQPVGHIAGLASSTISFVAGLIGISCGTVIGFSFDGTIMPLMTGSFLVSFISFGFMVWANRGQLPAENTIPDILQNEPHRTS